jgi:hypothetical protein
MKVRFQADADFTQDIVQAIRRKEAAIDFQIEAQKIGTLRRGDPCDRPQGSCFLQGEDKLRPYMRPKAVCQCRVLRFRYTAVGRVSW